MTTRILLPIMIAACAFLFYCSNPQTAGSETTNGITVAVIDRSVEVRTGKTMMISLHAASYLPFNQSGYTASMLVDSGGSFSFAVPDTGCYNLYARDTAMGQGALLQNIPVFDSTNGYADSAGFDSLSRLFGIVTFSDTPQVRAVVYAPGSPCFDSTDSSGGYSISYVPKGNIRFIAIKKVSVYWSDVPMIRADTVTAQVPIADLRSGLNFVLK
jgi:hypothetical protein